MLERPGVLEDISSRLRLARRRPIAEWLDVIDRQTWLTDDEARAYAGDGR